MKDRKVIIELDEHDAWQLLRLVQNKISQEPEIWQPYWKRLSQNIQRGIERADKNDN